MRDSVKSRSGIGHDNVFRTQTLRNDVNGSVDVDTLLLTLIFLQARGVFRLQLRPYARPTLPSPLFFAALKKVHQARNEVAQIGPKEVRCRSGRLAVTSFVNVHNPFFSIGSEL